jgi:hypothetical protein
MPVNATSTCSGTITFAPERPVTAGTYYAVAVDDTRGEVSESDELNNVTATAATVTVN